MQRRISAAQIRLITKDEELIVKAPFIILDNETGVIKSIKSMMGNQCEPGNTEYLEGRLEVGKKIEGKNYVKRVVSQIEGPITGEILQIRRNKEIKL